MKRIQNEIWNQNYGGCNFCCSKCKVEELLRIPGVGPYTAGAIASIAHKTVAPVGLDIHQ